MLVQLQGGVLGVQLEIGRGGLEGLRGDLLVTLLSLLDRRLHVAVLFFARLEGETL